MSFVSLASLGSDVSTIVGSTSMDLQRWSYATKHMDIDIGERATATPQPCYGRKQLIEGSIRLCGPPIQIQSMTVRLEARLATTDPHPGAQGGCTSTLFLQERNLYDGRSMLRWDATYCFSFAIPEEIYFNGGTSPTPPSFSFWDCGAGCDVSFIINICMIRKRYGFDYSETRTIDILYLPKSCPQTQGPAQVWTDCTKTPLSIHRSHDIIPSGENVPFSLRLPAPLKTDTPRHSNSLVTIYKRLVMCRGLGKRDQTREIPIAAGVVTKQETLEDGETLVSGTIRAGKAGKDVSWHVNGAVKVEYVLKVSFPSKKHGSKTDAEEIIHLTTDSWRSDLNGPALELQECANPRDDLGLSIRFVGI